MIARIVIPLILVIVLSDVYIDMHYFRHHYHVKWWQRLLWWIPCIGMVVYTLLLASIRNFAPADLTWINVYLFLLGMFVGPKAIFTLCSSIGWIIRKTIIPTRRNYGHYVGLLLGFIAFAAYVYGLTIGVGKIRVSHVDLSFSSLPKGMDGLRIVHISDIHAGTFDGWRQSILENEVDSVNAQHADLIVFTGDIQNMRPQEVDKQSAILSRMHGVIAVLGNHDYANYVKQEPGLEAKMRLQLLSIINDKLRWRCLNNSHITLYRAGGRLSTKPLPGADSIVIAGTENDGKPPFPNRADTRKAVEGVANNAFVIMLQHDPSAWHRHILPLTNAQLTLSGHTHGGQMQIFGWRPTKRPHRQDCGLYWYRDRALYVNAGLGGLVPFRLNMPNEVTVITLHKSRVASPVPHEVPNHRKY